MLRISQLRTQWNIISSITVLQSGINHASWFGCPVQNTEEWIGFFKAPSKKDNKPRLTYIFREKQS